jgi:general secretion pathway protein H
MSSTGNRPVAIAGFTLLELLVVLAIIGLVLAIVPPNLMKGTGAQALKADARLVVSGLQYARTRAISLNVPVALVIDSRTGRLSIDGKQQIGNLSASTELSALNGQQVWQTGAGTAIRFLPDGGSTGGEILLSYHKTRYRLSINWLTGAVTTSRE